MLPDGFGGGRRGGRRNGVTLSWDMNVLNRPLPARAISSRQLLHEIGRDLAAAVFGGRFTDEALE
jgi:hypothetical protein